MMEAPKVEIVLSNQEFYELEQNLKEAIAIAVEQRGCPPRRTTTAIRIDHLRRNGWLYQNDFYSWMKVLVSSIKWSWETTGKKPESAIAGTVKLVNAIGYKSVKDYFDETRKV